MRRRHAPHDKPTRHFPSDVESTTRDGSAVFPVRTAHALAPNPSSVDPSAGLPTASRGTLIAITFLSRSRSEDGVVIVLRWMLAATLLLPAACTRRGTTTEPSRSPGRSSPSSPAASIGGTGWRRIADAPSARQEVAAAVVDGEVFVAGGLTANGVTAAVSRYDPATDRWRGAPSLPLRLHHATAVGFRGSLMVIGGFAEGGRASDRVFVLEGERWLQGPKLRRARGAAGAAVAGDRVVVAGGIAGGIHVGPVEIFDGRSWSDGAPIPTPRDHLAVSTDGKLIYAAAGRRGAEQFGAFESYDPAADRWHTLPDVPTPRSGLGGAVVAGMVVIAGGEGPRMFPEVEAYDIARGAWIRLPDLGVPRHGLGVVAADGRVYALAGGEKVGLGASRVCEVLGTG